MAPACVQPTRLPYSSPSEALRRQAEAGKREYHQPMLPAVNAWSVSVLLLLPLATHGALRGGDDRIGRGPVSLDLPGVSINIPGITTPSSSNADNSTDDGSSGIVIGNNSISIGGQTIVSWGSNSTSSATCENLPSTNLRDEPSCESALPDFYNATTDENFTEASDRQRTRVMDSFCRTKCGQVFTARSVATRLKCNDRRPTDNTTSDVDSGVINVPSVSAGEGVSVVVPGIVNITNTTRRPSSPSKGDGRLLVLDEDLKPDFSDEFPGLYLGCIKDSRDNAYCATKRADPDERECDFYRSCCYAELNAITEIDLQQATYIETRCLGSTIYRLGALCTA